MVQSFPPVPVEILQEIFTTTAFVQPSLTPALSLVSALARACVLPRIFELLILNDAAATTAFYRLLLSAEQQHFRALYPTPLAHYVRDLGIYATGPLDTIAYILERCQRLRNVALGFNVAHLATLSKGNDNILVSSESLREQHLVSFANRDGVSFASIHPHVTKLHVQITHAHLASLRNVQDRFPALTHLAVSLPSTAVNAWDVVVPELIALMGSNPRLKVVLIQVARSSSAGSTDPTQTMLAADPRLVVFHAPMSLAKQWESALDHPSGIWRVAEERMKKRKSRLMVGGKAGSARASARDSRTSASSELALLRQSFAGLKRMTVIQSGYGDEDVFSDSDSE